MHRILLLALPLFVACHAKVRSAFDERLQATLAEPAPLPRDWRPDAVVHLSDELIGRAFEAGLGRGVLDVPVELAGVTATPSLEVRDMVVDLPSGPCTSCVGLRTSLQGDVGIAALGTSLRAPVAADLQVDVEVYAERVDGGWAVLVRPVEVGDVAVRLGEAVPGALQAVPLGSLERWLATRLVEVVPPAPVARLGGAALPLQGLRVRPLEDGLVIDLRTSAAEPVARVPAPPPAPQGWSARVPVERVLSVARRASFDRGPESGVWVDPTGLAVDGDRFTLDVRLWRPSRGWWRDYRAHGAVALEGGRLRLVPDEVVQVDASGGAGLADPLAALGGGRILDAIGQALDATLPASGTQDVRGTRATWIVTDVATAGGDLVLRGDVRFGR